eukprot:4954863-Pyramimonas_sp.AAC.1
MRPSSSKQTASTAGASHQQRRKSNLRRPKRSLRKLSFSLSLRPRASWSWWLRHISLSRILRRCVKKRRPASPTGPTPFAE